MLFETKAKVRGRVRWTLYDKDGNRIPAMTERGPVWGGHWNSNLITNIGMNRVGTNGSTSLRTYSGIGTSSAVPAFTDSTLGNEVQRTNSTGGFSESTTYIFDSGTSELVRTATRIRLHEITASYNLTEYGYTGTDSTADYTIRELFRDETDTPVTISVVSGIQLKIEHEMEWRLPAAYATSEFDMPEEDALGNSVPEITDATNASPIVITTGTAHGLTTGDKVTIADVAGNTAANGTWTVTVVDSTSYSLDGSTGSGTYTASTGTMARRYVVESGFYQGGTGGTNGPRTFQCWNPTTGYSSSAVAFGLFSTEPADLNTGDQPDEYTTFTVEAYVADSYQRDVTVTLSPSQEAYAHQGYAFYHRFSGFSSGWRLRYVTPSEFVKADTHELVLTFRRSWARA